MKLIDKDAVVAEITHKIKVLEAFIKNFDGISDKVEKAKNKIEALGDALLFIENLEVKEVDIDREIGKFFGDDDWKAGAFEEEQRDMIKFAKHFFELGLKAAQKL